MKDNVDEIFKKLEDHEKRIKSLEAISGILNKKATKNSSETSTPENLIISIINKIGDCEEGELIQSKILDTRSAEGKVLLSFYISNKYFENRWLRSGDVEKITSELGIKIDVRNITNKIKELRKYLESGSVRKRGQPTPYRLNRKGVKRFEEIIDNGEK